MTMSSPLFEAIGMAVLHLLWQGLLLAGVLAVALRLLSRSSANIRYAISCAALATLVILGVVTAQRSYDAGETVVTTSDETPVVMISEATTVEFEPGLVARATIFTRVHSSTIAIVWLAGVLLLAARLAFNWTRTRGLVKASATPMPEPWQEAVVRISTRMGLGRVVTLVESAAVDVPSVVGFLKPVVLVPASSLTGLSTQQMEMILAHELAHIRRHDYLVNMLQSVVETLLFYHPAAWWISRQIRIERENCCDDLAVTTCGNAMEYARALTALEQLRDRPAFAVAANGGSLLDRIKRLVGSHERRVNGWTAITAAVSFAVVMMITSLPLQADRDTPPPPPPAPPAAEIDVVEPAMPALPAPPTPAARPAPRPSARPTIARTPAPALAPLPPMAFAIAGGDFDVDFDTEMDLDLDIDDEQESETPRTDGRLSINELIALRIHGVTPEYINEMRSLFGLLPIRDVTQMRAMDVSAKYVAELRAAGVAITSARDAISLRTFNVTPEMVRSLAAAGYTKLTARDLARLAAAGVDGDFIREMSKYREKK